MTMWLLVINKKINKLIFKKKIIYLNKNNKQTKKMFSNHIRKDSEETKRNYNSIFEKQQTNKQQGTHCKFGIMKKKFFSKILRL